MARKLDLQPSRTAAPPRILTELRTVWRAFVRSLYDPYRPERFYMRGPGPRWRAKNGLAGV